VYMKTYLRLYKCYPTVLQPYRILRGNWTSQRNELKLDVK
jgi:hypothetical protein